jgi:flagellar basal body-associated protein FliL
LFVFVATSQLHAAEESAAPAKPPAATAEAGDGEGDKTKKKSADVSGGRFNGDPIYVRLSPMVLPIINDEGVEQLVTLQITLDVKDFDTADTIHTYMPRVTDALMQALYGGLGEGSLQNGKLVDVAKVKAKAMTAVASIVGADGVHDVLITDVGQRMLY